MSHAKTIAKFSELLEFTQQELVLMQSFAQVLAIEEAALIDNNADRLTTVTDEKNGLLNQIFAVEKNRNSSLLAHGYSADVEGMRSLLSTVEAPKELDQIWQSLIAISTHAQETNRTNGILIHRQLNRNQSTLNLLQQNQQGGAIYGADGQSKNLPSTGRGIIAG